MSELDKETLVKNFKKKMQLLAGERTINDIKHRSGEIGRQEFKENRKNIGKRAQFLLDYTNMRMRIIEKRDDPETIQDKPADMLVDEIVQDALPKLNPMDSRRITTGNSEKVQEKFSQVFGKGEKDGSESRGSEETSGEDGESQS